MKKVKQTNRYGHPKIRFQGKEYVLAQCKYDGEKEGAIATTEDFETFVPGFAHSFPDGTIKRFGKVIGSHEDIEFLYEETI